MTKRRRLGEILIEAGLMNQTQLKAALESQKTWGGKFGSTLVRMGFVREEDILRALSEQLRLPSVDFRKVKVSPRALQTIPVHIAERYNVVPVAVKEEAGKARVILAMSDPTNLEAIGEIEFQASVNVRPVVASESSITRAIGHYYHNRKTLEELRPQRVVNLAEVKASEEMVIFNSGDEVRVAGEGDPGAKELFEALVRVLEAKGVLAREELERELRRSR